MPITSQPLNWIQSFKRDVSSIIHLLKSDSRLANRTSIQRDSNVTAFEWINRPNSINFPVNATTRFDSIRFYRRLFNHSKLMTNESTITLNSNWITIKLEIFTSRTCGLTTILIVSRIRRSELAGVQRSVTDSTESETNLMILDFAISCDPLSIAVQFVLSLIIKVAPVIITGVGV